MLIWTRGWRAMPKLCLKFFSLLIACLVLPQSVQAETRLFLPASLGGLQQDLKALWPHEDRLRIISGPSSQLVRQLGQGLEGTALITANQAWMEEAEKQHLIISASRQVFVKNSLTLAAQKPLPGLHKLQDLPTYIQEEQRLAICGPGPVPCGLYAKDALKRAGVYADIADNLIFGKDAAATRRFVESGAVDLAILYSSDITQSEKLHAVIEINDIEAVYEVARISTSKPIDFQHLMDFLHSRDIQNLLREKGFQTEVQP